MGSDHSQQKTTSFDLTSQVGVLQALYAVRTSELVSSEKNALRDQIFTYTKSGGDERLREQVEKKLAELPLSDEYYQKIETEEKKQAAEQEKNGLIGSRGAPKFSVPEVATHFSPDSVTKNEAEDSEVEQREQEVDIKEKQIETNVAHDSAPVNKTAEAETRIDKNSSASISRNQAADQASETKQAAPPTDTQPTPAPPTPEDPAPNAKSAPAPQSTEVPASANTPNPVLDSSSVDTSINRIREIKRHINNSIGNPVNLVDIDNTLGRQYMSTLLAAMQSVNAETGQAGSREMKALEDAFSAVLPLLDKADNPNPGAQETDSATESVSPAPAKPEPKPRSEVTTKPSPQEQSPAESQPVNTPKPVAPKDTPKPEPSTAPTATQNVDQNQVNKGSKETVTQEQPLGTANTKIETTEQPQPNNEKMQVPIRKEASEEPEAPNANPKTKQAESQSNNNVPVGVSTNTKTEEPVLQADDAQATVPPQPAGAAKVEPTTPKEPVSSTPTSEPRKKSTGGFQILPIHDDEDDESKEYGSIPGGVNHSAESRPVAPAKQAEPTKPTRPVRQNSDTSESATKNGWGESTQKETSSLKNEAEANNLEKQLETLDEQSEANKYKGDPLHAPEIDSGLEQLLHEWDLFKSSGLFGTGPNGREHPLYKKLAPMMVQDVASGRFEDARPEVVQSISDYMNGWRYEQGVVYEPGETFETYLRRVIKFILTGKP